MNINPGDIVTYKGEYWTVIKEIRAVGKWDGKKYTTTRRFALRKDSVERTAWITDITSVDFRI